MNVFCQWLIGNPAPAHGGRICLGPDRLEMYCSNLPPCPEPREPPIDGGWGSFGTWSKCSAPCNGGFRLRRRFCDSPSPQNGGAECNGCSIDYETCNAQKCPERQAIGPWTPWLQYSNNNTAASRERMEKRFRYLCKFNSTDARVYKAKEENRVCLDRTCHRVDEDNIDSNITESKGGQQIRNDGKKHISGECNTHPCECSFGNNSYIGHFNLNGLFLLHS